MLPFTRFLTISLLVCLAGSAHAAPKHLITATQQLRAAGVNKMLFAEEHDNPDNFLIYISLLIGASLNTPDETNLWFEGHARSAEERRTYAKMHAKFNAGGAGRAEVVNNPMLWSEFSSGQSASNGNKFAQDQPVLTRQLYHALDNLPLRIHRLEYSGSPTPATLDEFIAQPGFGLAKTGDMHVMGEWAGANQLRYPGGLLVPIVGNLWHPPLSLAQQRAALGGYARAQQAGPAVLIVKSTNWQKGMQEYLDFTGIAARAPTLAEGFLPQGHGLLRIDMGSYNVTMIGPCSLLPVMKKIRKNSPRTVVGLTFNASFVCPQDDGQEQDEL